MKFKNNINLIIFRYLILMFSRICSWVPKLQIRKFHSYSHKISSNHVSNYLITKIYRHQRLTDQEKDILYNKIDHFKTDTIRLIKIIINYYDIQLMEINQNICELEKNPDSPQNINKLNKLNQDSQEISDYLNKLKNLDTDNIESMIDLYNKREFINFFINLFE